MLAEFLKLIQDTAVQANGATVVKVAEHAKNAYLIQHGQALAVEVPPPLISHSLCSVDSLVEFARDLTEHSEVWHSETKVVAVLDSRDRRDRATLHLEFSSAFSLLQNLAGRRAPFTQRELILVLRHDLRNAGVEHVLSAIKRLDFRRTNDGRTNVEHGRESLGRSVEMEINSPESIPEFFVATVPIYATPGVNFQRGVYCTIEIDVANERFLVLPDDDSIAAAIHETQIDLGGWLSEHLDQIPVFYGSP